jgi:His-Xaa-Ser system radical SAM maturase HxsC
VIRLTLPAASDAEAAYVARLNTGRGGVDEADAALVDEDAEGVTYLGRHGVLAIDGASATELDGDVVIVDPVGGRAERILRRGSGHNTLLVTERCDQLCLMCSQPPKKTHVDRFALFEQACLLAEPDSLIGISGGEPTLYKADLLGMLESVLAERPDLEFHVLTNGQFFDDDDVARLRDERYTSVSWGIPIYAANAALHDRIVGKDGAFSRLEKSMAVLARAGARIELRTVLVADNADALTRLAKYVAKRLRFIEVWSIMQLENIGFARARWASLFVEHARDFGPIGDAIDHAALHGIRAQLFNFPRCTVPEPWRDLARASISDWKRRYADACAPCRERDACSGFFEWHPIQQAEDGVTPL